MCLTACRFGATVGSPTVFHVESRMVLVEAGTLFMLSCNCQPTAHKSWKQPRCGNVVRHLHELVHGVTSLFMVLAVLYFATKHFC